MRYRVEFEQEREIFGCADCPFCYDCISCSASYYNYKWNFDWLYKKPDWCPLVKASENTETLKCKELKKAAMKAAFETLKAMSDEAFQKALKEGLNAGSLDSIADILKEDIKKEKEEQVDAAAKRLEDI